MNVQTKGMSLEGEAANLGTDPIPAKAYYDPDYFEAERQSIFLKVWINVGHVCDLPENGSFFRREIEFAKASILVTRGKDGQVRTFYNACTHRGTQLEDAPCGKKATFSCPYHMWTFGTDGKLISAPDFDKFYVAKETLGLREIATEICGGIIFINFDPQPEQTLKEYLGPLYDRVDTMPIASATTYAEYVYEIDANWKLTYDNFQENYHLRFIHPKTGKATFDPANPFGYPLAANIFGEHRTQTIWSNPNSGEHILPWQMAGFARGGARAAKEGYLNHPEGRTYYALFPSFFLMGTPTLQFQHTVYPIEAGKSRGVIRIYWIGDDETAGVRYARELALAMTRDVHTEDRAVIEGGHKGLASGALEFVHFQEQEVLCRHLFLAVDARVQAYKSAQAQKG
jgi:phenylpropionate dioxygenase-like ring-hydroxylating dioxygenase large terminal subunit